MNMKQNFRVLIFGGCVLSFGGCGLASLPGGYTKMEEQTVKELSGANFAPRSQEEREAIMTQDLFTQTAFWSKEYDLNPADLEAAINLAANLRKMGNPAQSAEIAQHTRALYPRDIGLISELAASLVADNKYRKAIKVIDEGLSYAPNTARLWSLKGAALDQLEEFSAARQNYTKALAINPNDTATLANVGLSYALEGDPVTAEIWLRQAAQKPDASPAVRQNLALVLGLQGKFSDAENLIRQDADGETVEKNLAYLRDLRGAAPAKPMGAQNPNRSKRASRTYGAVMNTRPSPTPRPQTNAQKPQSMQPGMMANPQMRANQMQLRSGYNAANARPTAVPNQRRDIQARPVQNQQTQAPTLAQAYGQARPVQQGYANPNMRPNTRQAAPAQNVLANIARQNQSKRALAMQQKAALANRQANLQRQMMQGAQPPVAPGSGYMQAPMVPGSQGGAPYGQTYGQTYGQLTAPVRSPYPVQQNPYGGPSPVIRGANGQPVYMPVQPQAQMPAQAGTPVQGRAPARARRY